MSALAQHVERRRAPAAARRAYSFERAGSLWMPKGKRDERLECWGGIGGAWGTRSVADGTPDTPLTLSDSSLLKCWLIADRGLTLNSTLAASGGTPPTPVTISGTLNQSSGIAFKIDSVAAGTSRGLATFSAYNDGGVTPYPGLTGIPTAADVDLTSTLGVHVQWPVSSSYSTTNVYTTTIASWTDQVASHVFAGTGGVTSSPSALWQGLNNRPVITCNGSNNTRLSCTDSLASLFNGNDTAVTVFMVMKANNATPGGSNPWLNFSDNTATHTGRFDFGVTNSGNAYRSTKTDDVGTSAIPTGGALDTSWHYSSWNHAGTTMVLRVDGSDVSLSGSGAQNVSTCTFNEVLLFARNTGIVGGPSNSIEGGIAELMIYLGTLGTTSVLEKETYLKSRWLPS